MSRYDEALAGSHHEKYAVLKQQMRYAAEGLKIDVSDFKVLAGSLYWLNEWETRVHEGKIRKEQFLTKVTADGLRATILSAMQLTTYLLNECHFSYVLTAKMNQDPLEVNTYSLILLFTSNTSIRSVAEWGFEVKENV
uniref:Uncharacterized protein n=1 Tax=Timema genevievae TaxID=629358 RepID=A0A7R9K717_TIMGE|nr:unnamed protein product [Timema genevievae]